jgi:hypothetical protein
MNIQQARARHHFVEQNHGIAERQRVVVLLVSCVIERAGDFFHGTPRALSISRKKWRRSCRK